LRRTPHDDSEGLITRVELLTLEENGQFQTATVETDLFLEEEGFVQRWRIIREVRRKDRASTRLFIMNR
jgi:hypothetical protein